MRNGNKKNTGFTLPAMRGKALHKHMAEKVFERLTAVGFHVSAEHPVRLAGGARDYVDLFAGHGVCSVGIEIETTPRNVLANAVKADESGLRLWIVTPNRQVSLAATKRLKRSGLLDGGWIRILTLGQFLNLDASQLCAFFKTGNCPGNVVNQSTHNSHRINNGDVQ